MEQFLYRITPRRPALLSDGPTAEEGLILAEHFAHLEALSKAGTVLAAGRTTNTDASAFGIVILRAEDEDAARRLMDTDPAVTGGVMDAELFPFRISLLGPIEDAS